MSTDGGDADLGVCDSEQRFALPFASGSDRAVLHVKKILAKVLQVFSDFAKKKDDSYFYGPWVLAVTCSLSVLLEEYWNIVFFWETASGRPSSHLFDVCFA